MQPEGVYIRPSLPHHVLHKQFSSKFHV